MEIAAILAVLLVIIGVPVVVVNRDLLFNRSAAKRARVEAPLPFLIIPSYLERSDAMPAGVAWQRAAAPRAPQPSQAPQAPPQETSLPEGEDEDSGNIEQEPSSDHRWMPPFDVAPAQSAGSYAPLELADFEDEAEEEASTDATVIFTRPVDEPMQILPGRLQIISGEPTTDDLRLFSRMGEPARIIVGRDTGPAHQHITLHSPTVSRRHARMDFENGSWTITNLSQTNPVLVNDRVLSNGGSARKLSNGDRIELGEVALRFLSS